MSGPQFIHVQTWSRKTNPAGQSVETVISEANRDPKFSAHVDNPTPPEALFGDPGTFKQQHDEHVAARATPVCKKDGSIGFRSIRKDRHTLASIVVSYPKPYSAISTDEDRAKLKQWQEANIGWMREKYGDQLRVVLLHTDESHPHLHAWILPDDPGADATTLHAGKQAKREIEAKAKADGLEPREAVKLGNRALKEEMTRFQDEYYGAVGLPMGLTRTGPNRRRLSRSQWKSEKADAVAKAAALAALQEQQRDLESRQCDIAEGEMFLDERLSSFDERLQNVEEREGGVLQAEDYIASKLEEVDARESAVQDREAASEEREQQCAVKLDAASRSLVEIEKQRRDLDARELKLAEIETKLERLLSRATELINRVGGIVRTWTEGLGLTVPKHEKSVGQLLIDLNALESDNRARIAIELSSEDPGQQPGI